MPTSEQRCSTCKGTGEYRGLTEVESCRDCGGTGQSATYHSAEVSLTGQFEYLLQTNATVSQIFQLGEQLGWAQDRMLRAIVCQLAKENEKLTQRLMEIQRSSQWHEYFRLTSLSSGNSVGSSRSGGSGRS